MVGPDWEEESSSVCHGAEPGSNGLSSISDSGMGTPLWLAVTVNSNSPSDARAKGENRLVRKRRTLKDFIVLSDNVGR